MDTQAGQDVDSATNGIGAGAAERAAQGAAPTIAFPQGLPRFPDATRFALLPLDATASGMLVLQCADEPDLRFLVLPYLEKRLPLRREDLDRACTLAGVPSERAAILLVVTRRPPVAAADGEGQLFVNLRAPVLVDTERRIAVQCVLPSPDYSMRHPLAAAA
jgi:flagellar assembly factor FliW